MSPYDPTIYEHTKKTYRSWFANIAGNSPNVLAIWGKNISNRETEFDDFVKKDWNYIAELFVAANEFLLEESKKDESD